MQTKNKLALALTAIIPAMPLAAHADVTVYGFLSGGVESAKATGNGTASKEYRSTTRVVDNNSRIGFKGIEDLGNGTKAIWQVESSLRNFEQGGTNDKGQAATFGTRNTFVGLQGDSWGTAVLGNYDSAYKRMTDIGLNVLADTTADMTPSGATGVFSRRNSRLANSVHYTSPVFSGVQVGASYGVDEVRTTGTVDGYRQNDDRFDLVGKYTNGGLQLALGYDREGSRLNTSGTANQTKSINNTQGFKGAVSYTFATGTLIGAAYERVKVDNTVAADTTQDDWMIALSQPITPQLALKAGYANLGELKNAATGNPGDYKAKQWLVGATYDLSKRTQVYAYGTKITNNSRQTANFGNNAIYSSNMGQSTAALDAGNDPQAFGIGLKVAF